MLHASESRMIKILQTDTHRLPKAAFDWIPLKSIWINDFSKLLQAGIIVAGIVSCEPTSLSNKSAKYRILRKVAYLVKDAIPVNGLHQNLCHICSTMVTFK